MSIGHTGTLQWIFFTKTHPKISSAKWRPYIPVEMSYNSISHVTCIRHCCVSFSVAYIVFIGTLKLSLLKIHFLFWTPDRLLKIWCSDNWNKSSKVYIRKSVRDMIDVYWGSRIAIWPVLHWIKLCYIGTWQSSGFQGWASNTGLARQIVLH